MSELLYVQKVCHPTFRVSQLNSLSVWLSVWNIDILKSQTSPLETLNNLDYFPKFIKKNSLTLTMSEHWISNRTYCTFWRKNIGLGQT